MTWCDRNGRHFCFSSLFSFDWMGLKNWFKGSCQFLNFENKFFGIRVPIQWCDGLTLRLDESIVFYKGQKSDFCYGRIAPKPNFWVSCIVNVTMFLCCCTATNTMTESPLRPFNVSSSNNHWINQIVPWPNCRWLMQWGCDWDLGPVL